VLWNPKVWLYNQGWSLVDMGAVQYIPVTRLAVFSHTNPLISYNSLITIYLRVRASFFPPIWLLTKIQHKILLYITRTAYQACLEGYGSSATWTPGGRYKQLFYPHRVPVPFLFRTSIQIFYTTMHMKCRINDTSINSQISRLQKIKVQ